MKIKVGSVVGNWLVKSETFRKGDVNYNTCECTCGTIKDVQTWALNNSKSKGCGCSNVKTRFKYKGVHDLSKAYFTSFKSSRKLKNIYFSDEITMEYLWDLFLLQERKCALSGLEINLNPRWSAQNSGKKTGLFQTASLDRIDNSKGYEMENVQWVHKDINYMRGGLSVDDFLFMCKKVSDNNPQYLLTENNFNGKRQYFGSTGTKGATIPDIKMRPSIEVKATDYDQFKMIN